MHRPAPSFQITASDGNMSTLLACRLCQHASIRTKCVSPSHMHWQACCKFLGISISRTGKS